MLKTYPTGLVANVSDSWNIYQALEFYGIDLKDAIMQRDGIDRKMVDRIIDAVIEEKFSIENIVFSSGGGLLRKFDRDSMQFAFKCCSAVVNGEERDVWKDPITSSSKKSKRGRLKLIKDGDEVLTVRAQDYPTDKDLLVPVFENGKILKEYTFDEIREKAEIV